MHPHKLLFSNILKQNKQPTHSLYFGLNLHGGNVSELQIENGEKPEDYHVTLLWGKFTPRSDIDDTVCRIQSVMEEIKNDIPKRLVFYHERRFEASESSDKKDVIVAAVTGGEMITLHNKLLSVLKDEKIEVEKTFPVYVPHLTLAYIEPGSEHELRVLDHSAMVKDVTVCIKNIATGEKEYERVFSLIAKTFSEVLKFNHNHDKLGRFCSGSGGGSAIRGSMVVPEKYKSFVDDVSKRKIEGVNFTEDEMYEDEEKFNTFQAFNHLTAKDFNSEYELERLDKKMTSLSQRYNGKKNQQTKAYTKEQYEKDVEQIEHKKSEIQRDKEEHALYNETFIKIAQAEGFSISKSPYGESYYAFPKGKKIDWGNKPEGSYRLSDHWDWTDGGTTTHCPTVDGKNYGKAICKVVNGKYELVMQLQSDVRKSQSFSELIAKFNPYHDARGRFTTAGTAASFTYRPGASAAHDRAIARERERVKQADKVIAGTNKMASYVIDNQFISSEKKQCVKDLQNCYQSIAMKNSVRWDAEKNKVIAKRSAINEFKDTARKVMERQEYEDTNTAQDYYELHRTIKRTPIKISDYDKQNIPDWNDYRKRAFGNLTISNNGLSIDSFYQELSSQFPHLFDSHRETSPSDQLEKLNEVLTSLKPRTYRLSGRDLEDAADDLALQMLNGYIAVIKP